MTASVERRRRALDEVPGLAHHRAGDRGRSPESLRAAVAASSIARNGRCATARRPRRARRAPRSACCRRTATGVSRCVTPLERTQMSAPEWGIRSEVARWKPTNSPSWIEDRTTEKTMPVSVTANRTRSWSRLRQARGTSRFTVIMDVTPLTNRHALFDARAAPAVPQRRLRAVDGVRFGARRLAASAAAAGFGLLTRPAAGRAGAAEGAGQAADACRPAMSVSMVWLIEPVGRDEGEPVLGHRDQQGDEAVTRGPQRLRRRLHVTGPDRAAGHRARRPRPGGTRRPGGRRSGRCARRAT